MQVSRKWSSQAKAGDAGHLRAGCDGCEHDPGRDDDGDDGICGSRSRHPSSGAIGGIERVGALGQVFGGWPLSTSGRRVPRNWLGALRRLKGLPPAEIDAVLDRHPAATLIGPVIESVALPAWRMIARRVGSHPSSTNRRNPARNGTGVEWARSVPSSATASKRPRPKETAMMMIGG